MFSRSQIITIPVLISSVLLLTGCPPPASFTQWKRASTTVEGVKAAMTECGDPVGSSMTHLPINEQVLQFQCMQRLGFIRTGLPGVRFPSPPAHVYHRNSLMVSRLAGEKTTGLF